MAGTVRMQGTGWQALQSKGHHCVCVCAHKHVLHAWGTGGPGTRPCLNTDADGPFTQASTSSTQSKPQSTTEHQSFQFPGAVLMLPVPQQQPGSPGLSFHTSTGAAEVPCSTSLYQFTLALSVCCFIALHIITAPKDTLPEWMVNHSSHA